MLDKIIKILHYAGIYQRINGKVQKARGTVKKVQAAAQKHPAEYKRLGDLVWQKSKLLLQYVRKKN